MGKLVEGVWHDVWYENEKGAFKREAAQLRDFIYAFPSDVPDGAPDYIAEKDRYHLYVSYACPWAHRTLIMRALKGLSSLIDVSVVGTMMLENGWTFDKTMGSTGDGLYDFKYAYELYTQNKKKYTGRVTVPILWDKKTKTIVNNESSEIIRIFNQAFNHLTGNTLDFYPKENQKEIDEINQFVYSTINNGVYKAGFATTQAAYEKAVTHLFDAMDTLERRLESQTYLCGEMLTEADIRLFTTLIRFDMVYYGHFKCNIRELKDYPNLLRLVKTIYHHEGIKETVHIDHIKEHYYVSHTKINPTQIVPVGPSLDYLED